MEISQIVKNMTEKRQKIALMILLIDRYILEKPNHTHINELRIVKLDETLVNNKA